MTRFIRDVIGTVAAMILASLSIFISLTTKALDWVGVDISGQFTCDVSTNDGSKGLNQTVAKLHNLIKLRDSQIAHIITMTNAVSDPEEFITNLENYLTMIRENKIK